MRSAGYLFAPSQRGRSSVVELYLAKVVVDGSNPFGRSKTTNRNLIHQVAVFYW